MRRDWSVQPKDTGCFVRDLNLSRDEKEIVNMDIREHLEDLAKKICSGELSNMQRRSLAFMLP